MTPTEQDDELREKLDIRDRLKSLSIFRLGFGFDTYELIDFILADRKRVALEARIDMAQRVTTHFVKSGVFELGFNHKGFIIGKDNLIKELQAELEEK